MFSSSFATQRPTDLDAMGWYSEDEGAPAEIDINSAEKEDLVAMEITVDSGAGETVANPKDFPDSELKPSPGSQHGQVYVGPGGERIPNLGQFSTDMNLEDLRAGRFTFQGAEVRKPLMSVSSVNDNGNMVVFDNEGSYIIPPTATTALKKIRELIQGVAGKVTLNRQHGVYNMKVWQQRKPGFTRQGR